MAKIITEALKCCICLSTFTSIRRPKDRRPVTCGTPNCVALARGRHTVVNDSESQWRELSSWGNIEFPSDPDPGDGGPLNLPLPIHSSFRSLTGNSSQLALQSPLAGIEP